MGESLATPFVMHGARDAVAGGLTHVEEQVKSIEQAIAENPGLAFDLARTLVESVCRAVLDERNITFSEHDDLPKLFKTASLHLPFLPPTLTLYRSAAGAVRDLRPEVLDHLNADEKASWQFIVGRDSVTSPVLMEQMGFDERKAQRVLKALLDSGLLRRVGRGPATRYEVVRP